MDRRGFLWKMATGAAGALVAPGAGAAAERKFYRVRIGLPEDGAARPISFGLVADTHYGDFDDTPRPRFFRSSLPNMGETAEMFEQEKVDFAVHLGDVIQESRSRTTSLAWLAAMDEQFRKYTGERHYLMGNHDLGDLSKADFIGATSGAFKASNYYFDHGGFRFIVIDANYREDEVSYDRGNFSWADTYVPQRQVVWISRTIDRARALGLKVILFSHQCFDDVSTDHRIGNAVELRTMFGYKGNVVAVFYGHRHAGGYYQFNGVHYFGIVATVNGPDPAAAIVRITPDGVLTVEGRGERQPDWGPISF